MIKPTTADSIKNDRLSEIRVRDTKLPKTVKITSPLKPEIVEPIINKWQSLLDTAASLCMVPSGLITKLSEETLDVFLNSQSTENPYKKGDRFNLGFGHYCERVIGMQHEMVIPNATQNPLWEEDAQTNIEMIAYMGVPINWPDGEVFGTLCMLDRHENYFSELYLKLVKQVKQHIESDLQLLILNKELQEQNERIENLNKLSSSFLSVISHDIRGGIGSIEQLLNVMITNYDTYNTQNLKPTLESLSQTVDCVFQTLENLLSWSKINLLELETKKTTFNVVKTIKDLLVYFQLSLSIKNIQITEDYASEKILVTADENMLNTSLRNIISNAIKFNKKNGQIRIKVHTSSGKTIIEVEDTGVGIEEKVLKNLFKYNSTLKQGNLGEACSGVGLLLIKDFLAKNSADVKVESQKGVGTRFRIEL